MEDQDGRPVEWYFVIIARGISVDLQYSVGRRHNICDNVTIDSVHLIFVTMLQLIQCT